MEYNAKVFAAILAASLNLILIVFVSLRNRRHIVYRSFIVISFCLLLWNLRVIISSLIAPADNASFFSILITQLFYPIVTACLYILPVTTLQFTISFIGSRARALQTAVWTAYGIAFILSIVYASQMLSHRTSDYILWLFILPLFILSLLLIGRAYLRSQRPLERARLGLLLIGGTIGVIGAITEDILRASGVSAGGLGNIANATYSLLVATCLFRHRLFDVSVTTRKMISLAFTSVLMLMIAYALALLLRISTIMPYGYIFIAVLMVLVLGRRITTYVEHVLFKKTRYIHETIDEVRYTLDRAQNIISLLEITTGIAHRNLAITKCVCVTYDELIKKYRSYCPKGDNDCSFTDSDRFADLALLIKKRASAEPLVYDEICHELNFGDQHGANKQETIELKQSMEQMECEVFVPLLQEKELGGAILLGEKGNGQAFTESDIQFLKILAYNCALQLAHLRMLERVRQLEQLAALGEMAAYIAHEVKNPLTIIRSSAQLMKSSPDDVNISNMIIEESDRLNRVVSRMLHFAKAPEPHPQRISIEKELKGLVEEITQSLKSKNIDLRLEYASELPSVKFDPDHLKQVITNLLLNAMEAIDESGRITISAMAVNNMVELAIIDNGPGIRSMEQSDVFQPFYTTKAGGSGLGLPITRRLLELNKGTIEFSSPPGKGCTFKIRLPRWNE